MRQIEPYTQKAAGAALGVTNMENLLFTIRSYHVNTKNTGIVLNCAARSKSGAYSTVRVYVPFKSPYEDCATSELLQALSGVDGGEFARVNVFRKKTFNDEEE